MPRIVQLRSEKVLGESSPLGTHDTKTAFKYPHSLDEHI